MKIKIKLTPEELQVFTQAIKEASYNKVLISNLINIFVTDYWKNNQTKYFERFLKVSENKKEIKISFTFGEAVNIYYYLIDYTVKTVYNSDILRDIIAKFDYWIANDTQFLQKNNAPEQILPAFIGSVE